jgi:hypothetical protein
VQWETTMQGVIKGGMETAYELGPGKVRADMGGGAGEGGRREGRRV